MSSYFQIVETQPITDGFSEEGGQLVFENEDCRFFYNFWEAGGNAGFTILNKTDHNLYVDLSECFFVCNGVVRNDFYNGETLTTSTSVASSGIAVSAANSVTSAVPQKCVVCIPPMTRRKFAGFSVFGEKAYVDCTETLKKQPSRSDEKEGRNSISFLSEAVSPMVFGNIIAYSHTKDCAQLIRERHDFYVTKITNINSFDARDSKPISELDACEREEAAPGQAYILVWRKGLVSPRSFYVKY